MFSSPLDVRNACKHLSKTDYYCGLRNLRRKLFKKSPDTVFGFIAFPKIIDEFPNSSNPELTYIDQLLNDQNEGDEVPLNFVSITLNLSLDLNSPQLPSYTCLPENLLSKM